ncbi:MAG: cell division protein FtsZ [Solirubrobacteraceae bacterium]|jgi:cell division protein FtsZ|nr:cell division protein FtsZ [Solirubrobacteraceae bacterium]
MASGKRASMREGPLAALFRKTDEGEQPEDGREERPGAVPGPSTPAAQERRAPAPDPPPHPRDTGYPHPSLGVRPQPEPTAEPRVATPQERLRHAFSADLPDDMLDRVPPGQAPRDPYARVADEPNPWGTARPVGHPVLRVVGVGGAGVNAVNRMVEAQVEGVEFLAINTDLQSLQQSTADVTLHIGPDVTRGLGAGSNPDLGRSAAMDDYDRIKALLKGSDMIFIAAGAGGGTGTGAAPIVARIAREIGALTVGIVTKPFGFEGNRRASAAEMGIQALGEEVDTLIVVPNNRLLTVLDKQTSMVDAFRVADDVLRQGVQGVSDLVTLPGLINLDFADVRTIMCDAGNALLGIGMGTGEDRAVQAAAAAIESPLLETSMEGARKILLSITGGPDLSLWEINEAAKAVSEAAHADANIIFGAMVDEKLGSEVWVTVVATGYTEGRIRSPRRDFEEPRGEVRVERRSRPSSTRQTGLGVHELDVPEFLPRR